MQQSQVQIGKSLLEYFLRPQCPLNFSFKLYLLEEGTHTMYGPYIQNVYHSFESFITSLLKISLREVSRELDVILARSHFIIFRRDEAVLMRVDVRGHFGDRTPD